MKAGHIAPNRLIFREFVNISRYQLTGGVFNHTATLTFLNTSQIVKIKQKYLGLDVFDQLRLEADIEGDIPSLPEEAKVNYSYIFATYYTCSDFRLVLTNMKRNTQ